MSRTATASRNIYLLSFYGYIGLLALYTLLVHGHHLGNILKEVVGTAYARNLVG